MDNICVAVQGTVSIDAEEYRELITSQAYLNVIMGQINPQTKFGTEAYVTFMRTPVISLSCVVRDHLAPCTHCCVVASKDGSVLIKGSYEQDDFKISIYAPTGQARIAKMSSVLNFSQYEKKRVPCDLLPDKTVRLRMSDAIKY